MYLPFATIGIILRQVLWGRPENYKVTVHRFRVQRSALPLTAEAASLIEKVTLALQSHIRGLRTKKGLKIRSPR